MGLLDDEGLGAAFGNEMLRRRATNERARMLARQQEPSLPPDINSSQFPRVNAAIQGLLGTAPDEMGISVLNPQAESIKAAADPAYVIGMALQGLPIVGGALKALGAGPKLAAGAESYMGRMGMMPQLDVYHGTPHRLPPTPRNPLGEFDASKIGTGEGAQAYGHGIYTAEALGVGQSYADKLGGGQFGSTSAANGSIADRLSSMFYGDGSNFNRGSRDISTLAKNMAIKTKVDANGLVHHQFKDGSEWIGSPNGWDVANIEKNLYKIDLPDEMIAKMLDYDKPLSKQPEIMKALTPEAMGLKLRVAPESGYMGYVSPDGVPIGIQVKGATPESFRKKWLDRLAEFGEAEGGAGRAIGYLGGNSSTSAAQVSEALRQAGIPGIKYLDATSRDAGKGTRNFVTFPGEEQNLTILERNGRGLTDMVQNQLAEKLIAEGVKPKTAYRSAREAEVGRVNRRIATTGQYVGAPPGVDSPQSLGAMVNNYLRGMEEGLPGRNFYTDSSKDIFSRTGNNITQSDLLAQNIATLSRANNVAGNTSMSAKAHIQAATGDPIRTGRFPSKDSPPLQTMYDAGQAEYLGHKRDPFATQLGVEYAPERVGRGVNDMHEAELMGYPSGKVGGATQHDFMDEVRARAIARANATQLGGFSDWNTGNAQAAAWTGNKIRRGDLSAGDAAKSYADYFPLHEANATYEAVSSPVTGHLQGLLDAPFAERLKFTQDPRGSWNTSAAGRDIGYTEAGMLPGETVETVGRFKDSANPAMVARPIVGTETSATGARVMTPGSQKSMTAVEAARAYFDAQEAGAWHKLMPAKDANAYTGSSIKFDRAFTQSDMEKIAPLFEQKGYYLASAPNGITVMANDATKTGKDFANEIKSIIKNNKNEFSNSNATFGTIESNYIDYGGAYRGGVPGSVTKEMLKYLDTAPKTASMLENSQAYKNTVLARNARDAEAAKAGYGVSRTDIERARKIFSEQGWEGLRRAAAAGTVPAAFMNVDWSSMSPD